MSPPAVSPTASKATLEPLAPMHGGLSFEMQRFSDGIRVVIAMLCTVLLVSADPRPGPVGLSLLIAYDLWAGLLLWGRSRSMRLGPPGLHLWLDAAWACAMLHVIPGANAMLILTLVHPTVLISVGQGPRQGVLMAVASALAIAVCTVDPASSWPHLRDSHLLPALAVLVLVPAAALLSRTMTVLHQRRQLMARIESEFDPRRGFDATATMIVRALRAETGVPLAALVLPSALGASAWFSSRTRGERRLLPLRQRELEAMLAELPESPVSQCRCLSRYATRGARIHGPGQVDKALAERLRALAGALEAQSVIAVPLRRYGRHHGHLLLATDAARIRDEDVDMLAHAAPELLRLVEAATLVDRLQDETAAHERARIGRDLHDSAIQPYLGLKFAVESVAMGVPADNPLHRDLSALRQLVNAEVDTLRELVVGMRSGQPQGDTALVTAVRRQASRFAQLFGIDVQVSSPAELPTSRELAGALFHMVNEALNNVRKHTPARSVQVSLAHADGAIELRVCDDAGRVRGSAMPDFLPRSLTERAAELGGQLHIARHGLDTELLIRIPQAAEDPAHDARRESAYASAFGLLSPQASTGAHAAAPPAAPRTPSVDIPLDALDALDSLTA